MVGSAEAWRRQINAFLLSRGAPVSFVDVGTHCMKPPDVKERLTDVLGTDPRFVISGSGHGKSVSSTGAEGPTAPAALQPPPADFPRNPGREPPPADFPRNPGRDACPFYMKEGYCGRGMKCTFDHPSDVAQVFFFFMTLERYTSL